MRNVFIDTNVFLHLRPLGDLPPKEICDGEFALWVPNKVIEELDRHKDSSDSKLKKRARSALKIIEGLESGPLKLNNGLLLHWFQADPANRWEEWGLDKSRGDDVIIATILTFNGQNQGDEVAILARDSAIRMRAGRFGIIKIATKSEHEQPEELDEDKKEIERLKRELIKQQVRQPKFKVGLSKLGEIQEPSRLVVNYSKCGFLDATAIEGLITKEEAELQLFTDVLYFHGVGNAAFFEPPPESKKKYNAEAREYLNKLRRFYSSQANAYFQRRALTVPVQLSLSNTGTGSATNVDIRLKYTVGQIGAGYPKEPIPPTRPDRPTGALESMHRGFEPILPRAFRDIDVMKRHEDGDATIRVLSSGGMEVSYKFSEIKHHESGKGELVYLTFPTVEHAKPFQITYEITCRELVDIIKDSLDVVVEVT